MAKKRSRRRQWTRDDVRELKASARQKTPAQDCSFTQENRGRHQTKGFQPGHLIGLAFLVLRAILIGSARRRGPPGRCHHPSRTADLGDLGFQSPLHGIFAAAAVEGEPRYMVVSAAKLVVSPFGRGSGIERPSIM